MRRNHARAILVVLTLAGVLACDQLLEVPPPAAVPASALEDPALAPVLVQGAIAELECALANYVTATALLTDELYSSTALGPVNTWDARTAFGSGGGIGCEPASSFNFGVYVPLATARFQAQDAFNRITRFPAASVPQRTRLLATAAAYAGYSYALLGEGFCEAAFDEGPALDWRAVLLLAEEWFSTALDLAHAAGDQALVNLARVGRARVRLDLNRAAEAAADAELVDSGFVKYATYSTTTDRRLNRVYESNQHVSVDPRFRNLTVESTPDSRVLVIDAGRTGSDGVTPQWVQTKYSSGASPIAIGGWDEAQLIIAEARGGQSAVDAINRLRRQANLPLFSGADPGSIAAQVRIERARELFLEGHRLNDMLRWGVPLDATNHKGIPVGNLTCLRLPNVELDNNPTLEGHTRRTTR